MNFIQVDEEFFSVSDAYSEKRKSEFSYRGVSYGRGPWVVGRGSWVVGRGPWVQSRGSWVVGTKSWVVSCGYQVVGRY